MKNIPTRTPAPTPHPKEIPIALIWRETTPAKKLGMRKCEKTPLESMTPFELIKYFILQAESAAMKEITNERDTGRAKV